jgi:hypothetical protein
VEAKIVVESARTGFIEGKSPIPETMMRRKVALVLTPLAVFLFLFLVPVLPYRCPFTAGTACYPGEVLGYQSPSLVLTNWHYGGMYWPPGHGNPFPDPHENQSDYGIAWWPRWVVSVYF